MNYYNLDGGSEANQPMDAGEITWSAYKNAYAKSLIKGAWHLHVVIQQEIR